MKKMLILILILLCTSCNLISSKNLQIENAKIEYSNSVKELEKINKSSDDMPFNIEIKYDKLTKDEIRYQVIIDNPKGEITNIKALAIHDKETDDVFPSVGIFEEKMNLIPNKKPEGIILVGYIPYSKSVKKFKVNMRVLISYEFNGKKYTRYFVTKK